MVPGLQAQGCTRHIRPMQILRHAGKALECATSTAASVDSRRPKETQSAQHLAGRGRMTPEHRPFCHRCRGTGVRYLARLRRVDGFDGVVVNPPFQASEGEVTK
jgi:hypothetical protein